MEDHEAQEALKSVKQLSQALQNEWKSRRNGLALLYIREQLGTAGRPEDEKQSINTRMELLAEFIQASSKVPTATPDRPDLVEMQADFLRRHGLPNDFKPLEPQTESGRKYLERFRSPSKYAGISEAQLKRWAWEVADEKAKASGNQAFVFDLYNKYIFADLLYYFAAEPRSKYPLEKGIALFGEVGVGKTILFEVFSTLLARKVPQSKRRFRIKQARRIMKEFKDIGSLILDEYAKGNLCIDDTGDEQTEAKIYGNSEPVIEELIKERYERWRRGSQEVTHITTNLDLEGLAKKYGERTFDRMQQMMTFQGVSGESRRRNTN